MKKASGKVRNRSPTEGSSHFSGEGRELVGVVAGGFEEPIETEIFKVMVPATSKRRIAGDLRIDTIVRVEAVDKTRTPVLGKIKRIVIQPGLPYKSAKDMAVAHRRGERERRGAGWSHLVNSWTGE